MRVTETLQAPVPIETARALLFDVPRVMRCIPGARLGDALSEGRYAAGIETSFGENAAHFDGTLSIEYGEDAVTVRLEGNESYGMIRTEGTVALTWVEVGPSLTGLEVAVQLDFSGRLAALASAAARVVAPRLLEKFRECLWAELLKGGR